MQIKAEIGSIFDANAAPLTFIAWGAGQPISGFHNDRYSANPGEVFYYKYPVHDESRYRFAKSD